MKRPFHTHTLPAISLAGLLLSSFALHAQTGPFDTEKWPATIDSKKPVHYVVTDGDFTPPGANWVADELQILSGGDQTTQDITIGGHAGKKVTGSNLNIADKSFTEWADDNVIDILVQAYGDAALLNPQGEPRNFNFLTGTLPELAFPVGGKIPVEAKNKKWNWILFRINNGLRPSDGSHFVGSVPANAQGASASGGVNGGTIRFEGVPNLIVRVVAFGAQGAFGEPEVVNLFAAPESCPPEPQTNLAGIDVHAKTANHMSVMNNGDQTVTFQDGVGPANDKRRAVRPNGNLLNFAVTDNFLGEPCNDPRAVKICVDFYDDPAFAGTQVRFGPEAYATDDKGGIAFYPADKRHDLTGSGKWIRRSWIVPSVSLKGVNVGTLTAGPRFVSENGQVFVSRFDLAVLRAGNHPLAGQDPLSNCYEDPNICTEAYGSYAELDLGKDIKNGLDVGNSGGDQEMIVAEAGPANDRRMAVRAARNDGTPGFAHTYLNFAILNEALGPSSQPNANLAICATYYDDPHLVGANFRPEVYQTDSGGLATLAFTSPSIAVKLEGSGSWRTAYWEIPNMKFLGVNQGPQAAARFVSSDKIFVTRLRYGVIRPCGPKAGINPVADCKPALDIGVKITLTADKKVRLAWPAAATGFSVQSTANLTAPQWAAVNAPSTVEGDQNVVVLSPPATTFYRLSK